MERSHGIINEAFEFEDDDTQIVPIDIKIDVGMVNLKTKLNLFEIENNHKHHDRELSQENVDKDQIYTKQTVHGEEIYVNLPENVVRDITNDFLADFTVNGFTYEDNLLQSNKQSYDVVFNNNVPVEENLYTDFNYFGMYHYESLDTNTDDVNKQEYAFSNADNESDNFKVLFDEMLNNTKIPFEKSCEELAPIGGLQHYHNILPENDVNETKQVLGIHNFVGNVDSRHNIDANAIDQTNEGRFELKLDAGDTKGVNACTNIGNPTLNKIGSNISEIMINDKTNSAAKNFNKTTVEKSIIFDDNYLKKRIGESVICSSNYDEIKYRFKGPVFRSFCEKKTKKNLKRRSLGGELKLVLSV